MTFDIAKCKPFDLERALAGDKVVTARGMEISELHYFKTMLGGFPIFAVVNGAIQRFSISGEWYYHDSERTSHLLMAPKTNRFVAWVNVYRYGIACVTYNTKKEAEECAGEGHIKTIKIEYEN